MKRFRVAGIETTRSTDPQSMAVVSSSASPAPSGVAHLSVADLSMSFGPRRLFRGLSLELDGGSLLAVTGRNGSGKSTLLRLLAGVLTPDSGRILLTDRGTGLSRESRTLRCGMVAPYLSVYDELTAYENLLFLARARAMRDPGIRIDSLLEQVGLRDRAGDRVATFSSGMKQRVKVAAALLSEPALLLLDEPSSNLDEAGAEMLSSLIQASATAGKLIVVATNDRREAERCDYELSLHDFVRN